MDKGCSQKEIDHILINSNISKSLFFNIYFWGLLCLFYWIGQLRADKKVLGGEKGAGSAKDLETGIELRSP